MRKAHLLATLVLVAGVDMPVSAQTNTGEIAGIVRDAQGLVLPGVTVVAEHVETGGKTARTTDERGRYFHPYLRVGRYVVTAELQGFRRGVRDGVVLQVGQVVSLDFMLEVGGVTEEIRVTAEVPQLQTANAEISNIVDNRRMVEMPMNGRNFIRSRS